MNASKLKERHLRAVPAAIGQATDEMILHAWEQKEPEFGALFHDHLVGVIDGTLYRVLGERSPEHDDLVQNTFEQILLTLADGKFKRACSLRSWAAAIAARVGLNAIRARQTWRRYFTREDVPTSDFTATSEDVVKASEDRQLLIQVRKQLGRLSKKRAEALLLHDVLGHSLAEVAALTGVTVSAAQSSLVRGRKELHERLVEQGIVFEEVSP